MAEWLGTGLQNLVHRFKSGSRLHPLFPCKGYCPLKSVLVLIGCTGCGAFAHGVADERLVSEEEG